MKLIASLLAALAIIGSASAQSYYNGGYMGQQGGYGQHQGYGQRGFTPPGAMDYSTLDGQWHMVMNGRADARPVAAQVDAQGRFLVKSGPVTWQGQFQGMVGQGVAMAPKRNGRGVDRFAIRLQFDGQCHIQAQMFVGNGQQGAAPIMIHVNHLAGQPCPR